MYELVQEDYHLVKPLIAGGHLHPEVISIIELNNPGWIFADTFTNPKSALVWSKGMQGFYLIGDHTNESFIHNLDEFIKRKIEPRMKAISLNYFEVSGHHDQWSMESIFRSRQLFQFEQLVLRLISKPILKRITKIETINLKTQDWECLKYRNTAFIGSHIGTFWSTRDDFKRDGFGYAAIYDNEVIGVCYSSFVTADTHAIGIETASSFQSKGVGTHLASLLVEEIYRNGYTPYWDCSLDNEPSKKLAERLGFNLVHRYTCSGFEL